MKKHHKIKLIAASIALMTSFSAFSGLGGLNVQSHLGEPFLGSIAVTGEEAKALLNGAKASISNANLRASIRKSDDKAIISVRSSKPIQDPVLIFKMGVGAQSREYTAIIDPAGYTVQSDGSTRTQNRNNQFGSTPVVVGENAYKVNKERIKSSANVTASRRNAIKRQNQHKSPQLASKNGRQEYDIVYGKRHLVLQGETLTGIAARIRLKGLSVSDTMQALVHANPDVFVDKNADRMLAGKVLNIPSLSELKQLVAQPPAENTDDGKLVQQDKASSQEQKVPVEAPAVANPVAPTVVASSPQAEQKKTIDPVVNEAASQPVTAPTSNPNHASAVVTDSVGTEEENSWWKWILGSAALAALLLLLKVVNKRKSVDEELSVASLDVVKMEDDGFSFDRMASDGLNKPKAENKSLENIGKAATVTAVGSASVTELATEKKEKSVIPSDFDDEEDFDDDIFFTPVEDVAVGQNIKKEDIVKIDLNSIENTQNGIVSGAVTRGDETEKLRDVDWNTVASTESVYEPEPENIYKDISLEVEQESEVVASRVVVEKNERLGDKEELDFFKEADNTETSSESVLSTEEMKNKQIDSWLSITEVESKKHSVINDNVIEFEPMEGSENKIESKGHSFDDQLNAASHSEWLPASETAEWETLDVTDSNARGDFVSESVGMTAPLEAKYELAKMYVEIGDPDAARETLHELLEESDGGILAKAKTLLKELNG